MPSGCWGNRKKTLEGLHFCRTLQTFSEMRLCVSLPYGRYLLLLSLRFCIYHMFDINAIGLFSYVLNILILYVGLYKNFELPTFLHWLSNVCYKFNYVFFAAIVKRQKYSRHTHKRQTDRNTKLSLQNRKTFKNYVSKTLQMRLY